MLRKNRCKILLLLICISIPLAYAADGASLLSNGDFEKGLEGITYKQWTGKKAPGYLDRKTPYAGRMCFRMTMPEGQGMRHIAFVAKGIQPHTNYRLSMMLSSKEIQHDGVSIKVLQFHGDQSDGWIKSPDVKIFTTGGTHDWKQFSTVIPASAINEDTNVLAIYINHHHINRGVLGVDDVQFIPLASSSTSSPPETLPKSELKSIRFRPNDPTILRMKNNALLSLRITTANTKKPSKNTVKGFYTFPTIPTVEVITVSVPQGRLSWKLKNGFGALIAEKADIDSSSGGSFVIPIPKKRGYYEIQARLKRGGKCVDSVHRSFGILGKLPNMKQDECFGLWGVSRDIMAMLGVHWTRKPVLYRLWKANRKGYLNKLQRQIDELHSNGCKAMMYWKGFPRKYAPTKHYKSVMRDTPEAWKYVETYWADVIKALDGYADAWSMVNEPYRGSWKGSDELLMKYAKLMRNLLDQYDADTPLAAPCLNTNKPHLMAQYEDLLKMGLGRCIDGIELHTYTAMAMPEDVDWEAKIKRVHQVTKEYANPKPIYSSEMGIPCDYQKELYQADYLTRSLLWAKKMGIKAVVWHVGRSNANDKNLRRKSFAILRAMPGSQCIEPRPAAVAFANLSRQLTGAQFHNELHYLGPAVKAFVFERDGKTILVLWSIDSQSHRVQLAVDRNQVTVVDMFGGKRQVHTKDGLLTMDISSSPQYVFPVSDSLQREKNIALLNEPISLLPRGEGTQILTVNNPLNVPALIELSFLPQKGWEVLAKKRRWKLSAKQTREETVTVRSLQDEQPGIKNLFGKVRLNKRYAATLTIPVQIQPRAQIVEVTPTMEMRLVPVLHGKVRRVDPSLQSVRVGVNNSEEQSLRIKFSGSEYAEFRLPLPQLSIDSAQHIDLNLMVGQSIVQSKSEEMSFVPVSYQKIPPQIDGILQEWQSETPRQQQSKFSVRWGWDNHHLYLAVRVKDKTHIQTRQISQMWLEDSIQVDIAPNADSQFIRLPVSELHETPYSEFCLALREDKTAAAHRSFSPNHQIANVGEIQRNGIRYAISRHNDTTQYEMQIPIKSLGLKLLDSGKVIRAAVLVNDEDGKGRTIMEWFSGIARGKNPNLFGQLILLAPEISSTP